MAALPALAHKRHGRIKRLLTATAAFVALMVLVSACSGSSSGSAATKTNGTLNIGVTTAVFSLNPAVDSGATGSGFMLYYPYATLIEKNPNDGSYGPGLAKSFEYIGSGNKSFELKLRPGLKFADGTVLNAQAVKTWLDYFPKAGGGYAKGLQISSITTPDNLTVQIELQTPTPLVPFYLSGAWGMILSPKAVADPSQLTAGAPGAGPYKYDQSQTVTGSNATYTFVPNQYYYDRAQIKWKKIVVKVIGDPATMLRAIQTGEIDVAMGDITTSAAAKSVGLNVSAATSGWIAASIIDSAGAKSKALGDVRVRQALNYAIDRQAIAKSLYSGVATPTSEPETSDVADPVLTNYYSYDPAKAKQLLAAAGYPQGFSFTLVAPTFGTGTPLAQALAQQWANVGIRVNIVAPATQTEFAQKYLTGSAFLTAYPSIPTIVLVSSQYLATSPNNPYKVDDATIDELANKAQSGPQSEQQSLAQQINKQITEQAYSVPVTTSPTLLYSSKSIAGLKAEPWQNQSPVAWNWQPA
jgi:peptide/nickel transport system substrate-binding protein